MATNFFGNVNITGDKTHIGDNYYYNSPEDFIKENSRLTSTGVELAELIFENCKSTEERQELLNSFRDLILNGKDQSKKESTEKSSNKIKDFLLTIGTGTAAKILADYGKDLYNYLIA